jgi:hypothetical protein
MTKVHMNPNEIRILDHLQGGPEFGHEGIKVFSHLEELLKNPHIVQNVHHHAQRHRHAFGGAIGNEAMRRLGRHGDSELAMIGPHTHRLFNEIVGHPTRNPHTGHPEYFSLSSALSGLWNGIKQVASPVVNAVKGVAQGVAPVLMPMAQQALGAEFGPMGQMAGNALSQGVQSVLGKPRETNPYSSFGQNVAQAYQGGARPSEALGRGLSNFGSQYGGGFGNSLSEMGQSLEQGRGFGDSMRRGAQRGYNELGGSQGLYNAVNNIGQGYMQGGYGGARQALGNQMNQYAQRALPQPANQRYGQYGENQYPHMSNQGYAEEPSQDYSEMFGNMFAGG